MSHRYELTKGIFKENPTFIIMLGMCPTLGVTTQVFNAFGMGASVLFVLLGSNIFISALRKIIPDSIRIPAYIVVIASFVTIVEMVLHGNGVGHVMSQVENIICRAQPQLLTERRL